MKRLAEAFLVGSTTQAHCILGEYYFIQQQYAKSQEHIGWILEKEAILEENFDDLLSEEINQARVLNELLARVSLG